MVCGRWLQLYVSHMCKKIFRFELQLSSCWQKVNFSRKVPKFHTFTKNKTKQNKTKQNKTKQNKTKQNKNKTKQNKKHVILKVQLETDRLTASTL